MIGARRRVLRFLDGVERRFGRLVAVRVDMQLNAGRVIDRDDPPEILRRDVPKPVRCAIVVSGPAQSRREPLNRSIDNDLHDPEVDPVTVLRA